MGIVRFITILIIAWIAYSLYKRYIHKKKLKRTQVKNISPQKVIKCEKCATHIPEHEAIQHKGHYYCSEEHKRQDLNN